MGAWCSLISLKSYVAARAFLTLAPGAVVSAATGDPNFFDGSTTLWARRIGTIKDPEMVGEVAGVSAGVCEVLEGCTTHVDCFAHHFSGCLTDRPRFGDAKSIAATAGSDTGPEECFVHVYIAQSGYKALV